MLYVPEQLTVSDRCDKCGAQALVRFTIMKYRRKNLQDLLFCGHHAAAYETMLKKKKFVVFQDIRS